MVTDDTGSAHAIKLLTQSSAVLLDFDGPVTALMADGANHSIANTMRNILDSAQVDYPDDIRDTQDPLAVLRYTGKLNDTEIVSAVEAACIAGEVRAADTCQPTPGGHEIIQACSTLGRPLVIVSNNSSDAVNRYLDRYEMKSLVTSVVARPYGQPELMKPNPTLVNIAVAILRTEPRMCVFIGDSVTDIQVSKMTGLRSIGYAKTTKRGAELAAADADALVDDLRTLAAGLRRPN